jgi:hypothetical protein
MNSGVEVALRQDLQTMRQRPTSLGGSRMRILSTMISSGRSSSTIVSGIAGALSSDLHMEKYLSYL